MTSVLEAETEVVHLCKLDICKYFRDALRRVSVRFHSGLNPSKAQGHIP